MACPLFLPGVRLPLSDLFGGTCAADASAELSVEMLRRCCNPGYARGECARAASSEVDSHRFLVRSADGTGVEVLWSSERDHHPIEVGMVRVWKEPAAPEGALEHQARAVAMDYLVRTGGI